MNNHDQEKYDRLTIVLHDQPIDVTGYLNGYIRMKFPSQVLTTVNLIDLLAEFNTMFIDDGLVISDIGLKRNGKNIHIS